MELPVCVPDVEMPVVQPVMVLQEMSVFVVVPPLKFKPVERLLTLQFLTVIVPVEFSRTMPCPFCAPVALLTSRLSKVKPEQLLA